MQKQYTVLILNPQPGVDVNMTDTNSYTALAWAAAWADKKDTVFLEMLANHSKIKLNQQDEYPHGCPPQDWPHGGQS